MNFYTKSFFIIVFFLSGFKQLYSQQFMMQGWYWDYPKTAEGKNWADSLNDKVEDLKASGFTHLWIPPHSTAASGQYSNGYDPKDLYIGNTTTGFGTRPSLDNLLIHMTSLDLHPVADMVMNHRDGGAPENNPAVKDYINNYNGTKVNNGDQPFPSDRFRCTLPLGGSSGNGAGDYYFKISSASQHSNFWNKEYKVYMQTSVVGYQNLPVITEAEPNGGGDCGQANNDLPLGVDMKAYVDASGCTVDEFHVYIAPGQYNVAGDQIEIYLTNPGGNYSDHRIYGIWNGAIGQNVIGQLNYQTYTDFSGLPSDLGEMHWDCFKPNYTNSTGLSGDQDGMLFFYDYDQNTDCARDALFAWALWNCQALGIKGFRLDAVKHFPANFVGDMLDYLYDNDVTLDLIVGEWYDTNAGPLAGWVNDVLASMDADTKAAMSPKIFDFSLRESLRQSCDQFGYDARNVFTSSLNSNGLSGYNVVTFANNHDFRDASGFASLVQNDVILPYAYILTNNQLGVPCVFYPDYFGYYGNAGDRSNPFPPLKGYIDQLIKVHQDYIIGATSVVNLTAIGSSYSSTYTTGFPTTSLIYQLKGLASGKDVVVAINFAGEALDVNQNIETTGIPNGTIFTDVTGLSTGADQITISGSVLNLKLAARSYAVWVEGDNPIIPLPLNIISFDAQKSGKNVQLSGSMTSLDNAKTITIQKSVDERNYSDWKNLEFDSKQPHVLFQLLDEKPALKNYYRIKSIENDGAINLSPVKTVFFSGSGIRLVNNLVDNELIFEGNIEKEFNYSITDINGRIISTQKLRGNMLNIQKLISGIYFIQIDGQEVYRFVKK